MHVISRQPFMDAAKRYPNDAVAIYQMYLILKKGNFKSPDTLKKIFPSLDYFKYKKKWWILDIGGNNLRLMAFIEFRDNRMYVKHIVTHAEYDKLCKKYRNEGG
ncbi:MAG: type II toxin-antitoxin system HigB family toxin [Gammaproteobacteria bacterium]|nr:type II toxin-antitoxin system HigB family toxin [Gammaproteobacteria bacterium]